MTAYQLVSFTDADEFREFVRAVRAKGWPLSVLAMWAGLAPKTLQRFARGAGNLSRHSRLAVFAAACALMDGGIA